MFAPPHIQDDESDDALKAEERPGLIMLSNMYAEPSPIQCVLQDDESDDALEAEERRAHEEAVQREVEALLAK